MLGKMNWANLSNYQIQPGDMDLFQTYAGAGSAAQRGATRTIGVISGGVITAVAGLTLQVSAGVGIMPDGTLVQWPALTKALGAASTTFARFDRVELTYTPTSNTSVLDVNSQSKVLDILNVVSINIVPGTASASPVLPAQTPANLSLGYINVTANMTLITTAAIFQPIDVALQVSAMVMNNSGLLRYNTSTGLLQYSNNGGSVWQTIGSGGGAGGGGAVWQGVQGSAPQESFELNEKSFKFSSGNTEAISLFVRVPDNYIPGTPIRLRLGHYGVTGANNFKFQAVSSLIRRNTDAFNSSANQWTSTNGDQVELGAFVYTEIVYDLSSPAGLINGITPNPFDMILITLTRVTPTATDDSGDVAIVPSTTEVLFQ